MPIAASELKLYLAQTLDNTPNNGGRMSDVLLDVVDFENNLFLDILKEEKDLGSTTYRKIFCKQENATGLSLYLSSAWVDNFTGGQDHIVIFLGTQTDTQSTLAPTRVYGASKLSTGVLAGTTTLPVLVEHISLMKNETWPIIQAGDMVRISEKETPTSGIGNEEWLTVQNVINTTDLGMTITTNKGTSFAYATGAVVSSMLPLGTIVSNTTDVSITSTSGTYSASNILTDNTSTIEDTYTFTIKPDGISFTVNSAFLGSLPDGVFNTNYTVSNSNFPGHNYVTVNSVGWGGTWVENDTLIFKTHPASKAVWVKRVLFANSEAYTNSKTLIGFNGLSIL